MNLKISSIRWVLVFFIVSLTVIGTIFSVNFIIDPFGNRDLLIDKKYKPAVHERSDKYNIIFNQNNIQKYNCIILGSSRVMSIIPENTQSSEQCYNFGIHVANNPEKLFILEEWLKHAPLKTVYIGNELYNVHSKNRPLYLNKHKFTNGSEENYLSIPTFLTSIKTLNNTIQNKLQINFAFDGSIRYYPEEQAIKEGIFDHSNRHFHEMAHENVQKDYIDNSFVYESKALDPLKKIKTLCDLHHVQIYPFITPTFYTVQSEIQSHPSLIVANEKFKKDLTKIFGIVYDFDVNASQNRNQKNFYDVVHYRPILGSLIFERFHKDNGYGNLLQEYHTNKDLNAIQQL